MNSDTGEIYRTQREINEALMRGERLEPIGPRVAEEDKAGRAIHPVVHRRQGTAAVLGAVTVMGAAGMSLPRPRPRKPLTDFDLRQLDLAEEKRERKRKARADRTDRAAVR